MGDCFGFQLYFMGKPLDMRKKPQPRIGMSRVPIFIQSTLSKADTLGTKATARVREVSALERVQLQRYKCNSAGSGPNLLSGLESVRLERVDCSDIAEIRTILTGAEGEGGGGGGCGVVASPVEEEHHITFVCAKRSVELVVKLHQDVIFANLRKQDVKSSQRQLFFETSFCGHLFPGKRKKVYKIIEKGKY